MSAINQQKELNKEPTKARCKWVDIAKGMAIILVLLSHTQFWDFCEAHPSTFTNALGTLASIGCASFMAVFFFLSGYTFQDKPHVLSQKARRLIAPYIKWGILYLSLDTSVRLFMGSYNHLTLAKHSCGILYSRFALFPFGETSNIFLFPAGAGPLWFLTCLLLSYVFFIPLIRNRHRVLLMITYITITFCVSFLPILLPWSLDTALTGTIFIYAGYKFRNIKGINATSFTKAVIFTLICTIYVSLVIYNGNINMSVRIFGKHTSSLFIFILIGITGSYIFCTIAKFLEKVFLSTILANIGKISLTLMCSHLLAYMAIDRILTPSFPLYCDIMKPTGLRFLIQIISAIIFAFAIEKVFSIIKKLDLNNKRSKIEAIDK